MYEKSNRREAVAREIFWGLFDISESKFGMNASTMGFWNKIAMFLLILTFIVTAGTRILNDKYLRLNGDLEFNFTRVDLGTKRSRMQCSQACSVDSSCIGVGVQETNGGKVRCFKVVLWDLPFKDLAWVV